MLYEDFFANGIFLNWINREEYTRIKTPIFLNVEISNKRQDPHKMKNTSLSIFLILKIWITDWALSKLINEYYWLVAALLKQPELHVLGVSYITAILYCICVSARFMMQCRYAVIFGPAWIYVFPFSHLDTTICWNSSSQANCRTLAGMYVLYVQEVLTQFM